MSPREAWAAIRESVLFVIAVATTLVTTGAFLVRDHQRIQASAVRISIDSARVDTLMADRQPQRDALRAIQLSLCARDSIPLTRELNKCPDSLHP